MAHSSARSAGQCHGAMLAILRPQRFWETHERVSTAGKMLLIDRAETKASRMCDSTRLKVVWVTGEIF